jgi:hypothetical protein
MASRMATSYKPQTTQVNGKSPSELSLNLTLTQHPYDENLEPRELCIHLEVRPSRA